MQVKPAPQHLGNFTVNVFVTLNSEQKPITYWRLVVGGFVLRIANLILGTKIEVEYG
jgi:hypothetical protein